MAHFQIVTADEWDAEREALVRPGAEHAGIVYAFIEAFGPWPEDTFVLQARSESGERLKRSLPLGSAPLEWYDRMVYGFRLPPGVWFLEINSAHARGVVASRKVVVR